MREYVFEYLENDRDMPLIEGRFPDCVLTGVFDLIPDPISSFPPADEGSNTCFQNMSTKDTMSVTRYNNSNNNNMTEHGKEIQEISIINNDINSTDAIKNQHNNQDKFSDHHNNDTTRNKNEQREHDDMDYQNNEETDNNSTYDDKYETNTAKCDAVMGQSLNNEQENETIENSNIEEKEIDILKENVQDIFDQLTNLELLVHSLHEKIDVITKHIL